MRLWPTLTAIATGITHGRRIVVRVVSTYARRNPVALFYLLYFTLLLVCLVTFLIYLYRT
jgi:hypothetical protein